MSKTAAVELPCPECGEMSPSIEEWARYMCLECWVEFEPPSGERDAGPREGKE